MSRRGTAILAVGLLLTLGPGSLPAFAGTPPPTPPLVPPAPFFPTGQSIPSLWAPPPVDMTMLADLPPDNPKGTPDGSFGLASGDGCIRSGVGNVTLVDSPPAQQMLNIATAQQFSTGAGVTVAEIDTGVNPHPYLRSHLRNGGDYILGDGNALIDCDGHGTIVAGIIAADTRGAGTAFTGVAPDATILAIKHTSTHYTESVNGQTVPAGDLHTLAEAIKYAADQPSVRVITMSVDDCVTAANAFPTLHGVWAEQLQAAIHYAVHVKDDVVVAAAGNLTSSSADQNGQQQAECSNVAQNDNPDPNEVNQVQIPPVYSDDVVSVASVNPETGAPSPFSVWGPWVTIAAPGQFITSVDPAGDALSNQTIENNEKITLQGTSFAAPYVAGVVALIRSRYPNLTAPQVIQRIEATAQHPSGPAGRNNQVGYGIIDPVAALTAAIPGQNGVPEPANRSIPAVLPQPAIKDWTPVRVALIGSALALALLLATLFVVHTVRRNGVEQDA